MDNTIIQIIPLLYVSCIICKDKNNSKLRILLYYYTYIYRIQYIYNKLYISILRITRITFCKLNNNNHVAIIQSLYTAYNAISNRRQVYRCVSLILSYYNKIGKI